MDLVWHAWLGYVEQYVEASFSEDGSKLIGCAPYTIIINIFEPLFNRDVFFHKYKARLLSTSSCSLRKPILSNPFQKVD